MNARLVPQGFLGPTLFLSLVLPALAGALNLFGQPCPLGWSDRLAGGEVNSDVSALAVGDLGSGPALYVGGVFTRIGGSSFNRIARWDGSSWSALGSGLDSSYAAVFALVIFDDGGGPALYAGGEFTSAGGASANFIARWDGSSWSALSGGMDGPVRALAVFDDGGGPALYAGGDFTSAGGVGANRIARWDGTSWSALGSGIGGAVYTSVSALAVFDDGGGPALYAGGLFSAAGGGSANFIARWDGAAWSALGAGTNNDVLALAVFDDGGGPALYAGGDFTTAGGMSANRIARWDGTSWSALGEGVDAPDTSPRVCVLAPFDDGGGSSLCVGGDFATAGGASAGRIARWSGSGWSAMGGGMTDLEAVILALASFDTGEAGGPSLFAGGGFEIADGSRAVRLARWSGTGWLPLGGGTNGIVYCLTSFDDGAGDGPGLVAGGYFTAAGGAAARKIARWDGTSWSPLGGGLDGTVSALAVLDYGSGPALYAGGDFTTAGGIDASRIARWDGSSWSVLASGLNGAVNAQAVFDDGSGPALYVGGAFTAAGGALASRIARWDGASWSALGSGLDNRVRALAVFDDGSGPALYAGGAFTTAGGAPVSRIARWDGSSWLPLGSGLNGTVYALAVFDDGGGPALFAGGDFTMAGGLDASRIARWDGASWSPLGSGLDNRVRALAVFDDGSGPALYAGGAFTTAGGAPAGRIARWDGASWSGIGGGVQGSVEALAAHAEMGGGGPSLFVGGEFQTAGGVSSERIARWGCISTIEVGIACLPASGTLPWTLNLSCRLENPTVHSRRLAGRIDVHLANGSQIGNYRAGYTNLAPHEVYETSWNQLLPAYGALFGDNVFHLLGEDVTPSPYNQPPCPGSGDTAAGSCTVTGFPP